MEIAKVAEIFEVWFCDPLYFLKKKKFEIKKRPVRVGRQLPLARWFTYSVFQTRILVCTVKQVIGLVFSYSDIKWTPTGWASWLNILWQLFKPKFDIEILLIIKPPRHITHRGKWVSKRLRPRHHNNTQIQNWHQQQQQHDSCGTNNI